VDRRRLDVNEIVGLVHVTMRVGTTTLTTLVIVLHDIVVFIGHLLVDDTTRDEVGYATVIIRASEDI